MKIVNITSNRTTEIQHFAAMCAFDAYAEGMREILDSTLPEHFYQALDRELGRRAIPNESTSFFITFERALDKRNGMASTATHWDNDIEEWREPTEAEKFAGRFNPGAWTNASHSLSQVCEAACHSITRSGDRLRYEFRDGSAIVTAPDGWDVEGDRPFSWRTAAT